MTDVRQGFGEEDRCARLVMGDGVVGGGGVWCCSGRDVVGAERPQKGVAGEGRPWARGGAYWAGKQAGWRSRRAGRGRGGSNVPGGMCVEVEVVVVVVVSRRRTVAELQRVSSELWATWDRWGLAGAHCWGSSEELGGGSGSMWPKRLIQPPGPTMAHGLIFTMDYLRIHSLELTRAIPAGILRTPYTNHLRTAVTAATTVAPLRGHTNRPRSQPRSREWCSSQ
jgi:hypothetical protein